VSAVSNKDDVQKLVASINKNLPALIDAGRTKGQIAVNAIVKLSETGQTVINEAGMLDGHSLACAKVSATSDLKAANSLKLLNTGSLHVTQTCQAHAK
jgi:hypothetical protein